MSFEMFVNNSTFTVGELIAALQSFDPKLPCYFQDPDNESRTWVIEHVEQDVGSVRII